MITDNLADIRNRIGQHTPTLIAVSKQQPDNKIEEALNAGLRIFGENRVQEAMTRWEARKQAHPDIRLHLIGPLQTNKVKHAVQLFDCIHTIDREKLAKSVHSHAPDMPCFIQVNVGNEPQKAGISTGECDNFLQFCTHDLGMNIIGLMCIPPIDPNPAPHFQWLADKACTFNLPNLSMGMSDDYETALECGATHIRIGSALFGQRN